MDDVLEVPADAGEGEPGVVSRWKTEITEALKRENAWRKLAQDTVDRYRAEAKPELSISQNKPQFNVLWSNTEVLKPALYGRVPTADIRPRFADADSKTLKDAARVLFRSVEYIKDAYDFDTVMKNAVSDYVLPGRGVSRVRYFPDEKKTCVEHVNWKDCVHGPGRTWDEVTWVGFRHRLTKKQGEKKFGEAWDGLNADYDSSEDRSDSDKETKHVFKRTTVWEIWDKDEKKVLFLAIDENNTLLMEVDDPLSLDEFFPIPVPLVAVMTTDSTIPIPDYQMYRAQAEELDTVSERIAMITKSIQAKGMYDSVLGDDIKNISDAQENTLTPMEGSTGGVSSLDSAIWMWPVEKLIVVLRELQARRNEILNTIYEMTGISDIMRGGATNASETLGAQSLKAQFGSQRLSSRQKAVQNYARGLIRLIAEVIAEKYEAVDLQAMTGLEVSQDMITLFRNDRLLNFMIDIETDSTIADELLREKQDMADAMGTMANLIGSLAPIVEQGKLSDQAAATIIKGMLRPFRLGKGIEDAWDTLGQPQMDENGQPKQKGPSPEEIQAQVEQAKMQMQQALDQAKMQIEQGKLEHQKQMDGAKLQIEQQKLQIEQSKVNTEAGISQQKLQIDQQKMAQDAQNKQSQLEQSSRQFEIGRRDQNIGNEGFQPDLFEDEMQQIEQIMGAFIERMDQRDQINAQTAQQTAQAIETLAQALTMPKRVVYEGGRPVGVEPAGFVN